MFFMNRHVSQKLRVASYSSIHTQVVSCTDHAGIPFRSIGLYFAAHFFDSLRRLFMLMGLINVLWLHDYCMRGLVAFVVNLFRFRAFRLFVLSRLAVGKEEVQ